MIADKNRVFDGWMTLEGGVDAGRLPYTLDPNQCVSATNVSFRGGSMSTRPGFRKIVEILPPIVRLPDNPFGSRDIHTEAQYWCYNSPYKTSTLDRIEGEYANAYTNEVPYTELHDFPYYEVPANLTGENSEYIYKHGIFQCAQAYSPHNGEDCIMALIGGRLFRIVPGPTTAQVRELPIHGEDRDLRNDRNSPIGYMCQADKWHIAQDGKSNAIIYDNATARRSKTAVDINHTEIPTGTIMAYGMGRLVVIVNGRDVAFGDLNGSHDLPDPADSLILFTERNFLAEGFDAAIPFTQGLATGMIFFPQLDTSTGNGQLMVFAERGATSFFMSLPREQWKTSSFQILALLTTGMRGHRSIAVVNEDLWFRSDDGVRSYRQARSEQSGWAHIPLSTNVKQFLKNDTDYLLKYCSGHLFRQPCHHDHFSHVEQRKADPLGRGSGRFRHHQLLQRCAYCRWTAFQASMGRPVVEHPVPADPVFDRHLQWRHPGICVRDGFQCGEPAL